MKSFVAALVATAIITIVAALGFSAVDMTAGSVYTSKHGNVRL